MTVHTWKDAQQFLMIYGKRYFKYDLVAGFVVFLVAIPLCLGIALASGAPLISGILSGAIGGIVAGILSGSQTSISGPAAGMAAVALAAITQLGDFNTFLVALTLAGILQILAGYLRAGIIAEYIPSNVVQGLLCAIGILLIIKQLPLAFTHSGSLYELTPLLLDTTTGFSLKPFFNLYNDLNGGALLISVLSLGLLIFFDKTKNSHLKILSGPVIVIVLGILLNALFDLIHSRLLQHSPELVHVPTISSMHDFLGQLKHPDWQGLSNPQVYLCAFIIALVGSVETLLNIKAIEKLDKKHRNLFSNRELFAQGASNLVAGLIGGIPITSVIARSSVNMEAGAKTRVAAIVHGLLIIFTVMLIPEALNKIPLSSLAALLMYIGYKLTKPAIFYNMYQQGSDRFLPFIVTVISIVIFNIFSGMLIGLAVSLFYILKSNSQARLDIIQEIYPNGVTNRLLLPQQVSFLNKASLTEQLNAVPKNSLFIIDAHSTTYIDKEILELIHQFKNEQAKERHISLNLVGFKDHYQIHNYINFINVTTYDIQSTLKPEQALNILQEGNQRFLMNIRIHRSFDLDIKHTADAQHPIAVVLGCIDSRVPVETIFDMTFGDLFCIRIAGNVVNADILASMEFACHFAKAKLIVVLGHTRCGAIKAACDGIVDGHLGQLIEKIQPSLLAEHRTEPHKNSDDPGYLNTITNLNIANTMMTIYEQSLILKNLIDHEEIAMVGAVYDVHSGMVHFDDYTQDLVDIRKNPDYGLIEKINKMIRK